MNWQPIETAPTDQPILVGCWEYCDGWDWIQSVAIWNSQWGWAGYSTIDNPTHWCPIPQPPPNAFNN